jgi:lipoprotein-anchoring transpeptidase ErfK/SrfK
MRAKLLFVLVALSSPIAATMTAQPSGARTPVVSETLASQIMLDRVGFSPGEIDGRSGPNLKRALLAFQQAHELTASGRVDPTTWTTLTKRATSQPPLITYDLVEADVAGPFVERIPEDLMEQAKLPSLGYTSALEALGEKFHASPTLLRSLNPAATFATAGEQIVVPNIAVPDPTAPIGGRRPAATIVVTKETSALTILDDQEHVLFHAPVTSGSEHDPLPIGTWKVTGVQRMPEFRYNPALFWDANPLHTKAKIPSGPNNPVGTVWIDLTKEHYGIHGTPDPGRIGHTQSHGCVRLTNWDAAHVAEWARPGTRVVFK